MPPAPTARSRGRSGRPAPHRGQGRPTGRCPTRRNARTSPGSSGSPSSAGPCRRCSSKPSPQSSGSNRPTPGSTPASPGNAVVVARSSVARVTSVGRSSSPASAARSRSGPWRPSDGRPSSSVSSIPSGSQDASSQGGVRGRAVALREQGAQRVEARVRVDPARARSGQHGLAFERKAGGVGEQVADRGAGRPGRLVEVDDAVLDGIEHGQGGDELRHGRPSETVDRRRRGSRRCRPGRRRPRRRGRRPSRRSWRGRSSMSSTAADASRRGRWMPGVRLGRAVRRGGGRSRRRRRRWRLPVRSSWPPSASSGHGPSRGRWWSSRRSSTAGCSGSCSARRWPTGRGWRP